MAYQRTFLWVYHGLFIVLLYLSLWRGQDSDVSNYDVKNPPINIHNFNFRCSVHCVVVRQSLGGWCEQLGLCDCETVWWHSYALLFGVLSCAEGQTLPPLLFAEWLNGPADEMWWLHWAPSIPTVGALKWLGSWLVCSSADPELQTCLENSPHPPSQKRFSWTKIPFPSRTLLAWVHTVKLQSLWSLTSNLNTLWHVNKVM